MAEMQPPPPRRILTITFFTVVRARARARPPLFSGIKTNSILFDAAPPAPAPLVLVRVMPGAA